MKRMGFRGVAVALLCILAVSGAAFAARLTGFPAQGVVASVHDGDTVTLATRERVRYLGLDAPEVAGGGAPGDCFGKEAGEANRRLVLGKTVSLRYGHEFTDRYGRLLALAFLPDGVCVNEVLVAEGLAWVYRTREGFPGFSRMLALQREAMRAGRGLWGACPVRVPEPHYVGNARSFVFHRPQCPLGREAARQNQVIFPAREAAFFEGFRPCRECKP